VRSGGSGHPLTIASSRADVLWEPVTAKAHHEGHRQHAPYDPTAHTTEVLRTFAGIDQT